jgi:high-affinity Fe2+/Pb2+ permease
MYLNPMYLVLGLLYFMLYYLKNLLLKKEFKFQSKLIFKLFLNGSSKLDKL